MGIKLNWVGLTITEFGRVFASGYPLEAVGVIIMVIGTICFILDK